jgi:hypothetical protein
MNFDFGFNNIFSQLIIGLLAMSLFMYGKKAQRLFPLLGGVAMGIYPFFIVNLWVLWGMTIGVMGLLFWLRNR